MTMHEARFRAMGCDVHLVVVGGDAPRLELLARERIEQLEARWSRFRDTSEISRLNAHPGVPVIVSPDTYLLVERAVRAWELTAGRYDPTVHDAVVGLGYDRDFRSVRADPAPSVPTFVRAPGCAGIRLDPILRAVTLPPDVRFDPGGIGKGLAADLVSAELVAAGADGAMVNLGGDLHARGVAPTDAGWVVGVEQPDDRAAHLAQVAIRGGAVCTSSRLRRQWVDTEGRVVHHVIDPATGAPLATEVVTVTVVAGEAWWAEALTKALFVVGVDDSKQLERLLINAHALIVLADATVRTFGDPGVFSAR